MGSSAPIFLIAHFVSLGRFKSTAKSAGNKSLELLEISSLELKISLELETSSLELKISLELETSSLELEISLLLDSIFSEELETLSDEEDFEMELEEIADEEIADELETFFDDELCSLLEEISSELELKISVGALLESSQAEIKNAKAAIQGMKYFMINSCGRKT